MTQVEGTVFDRDVDANAGYVYTQQASLSRRLANRRSLDVILETRMLDGRSVVDVGCGDGFFSWRFWDMAKPRSLTASDVARRAVAVARETAAERPINFAVADASLLPYRNDSFEVALVQSIIHHAADPLEVIREAFRVAPQIVIHEPNGNNLGLKVIEKTSSYHREHGERSFTTRQLFRWIAAAGGRVTSCRFAGFVPMFCPDWLAAGMKKIEPVLERTPLARDLACAVCVITASRVD